MCYFSCFISHAYSYKTIWGYDNTHTAFSDLLCLGPCPQHVDAIVEELWKADKLEGCADECWCNNEVDEECSILWQENAAVSNQEQKQNMNHVEIEEYLSQLIINLNALYSCFYRRNG